MARPLPLAVLAVFVLATTTVSPSAASPFPREALPTKSGYLPIPPANASLFFAFYEATDPLTAPASTPLILWLQGGPGCSSLTGSLFEHGPYLLGPDAASLARNPFAWNRRFGVIYLDNPLGTGFSAAPSPADIPTNQSAVAAHILTALQSFYALHPPGFRARPFFLAGESYGGKYVPAAAAHILAANPALPESERINLRGAAVGNGMTHPVAQVGAHADTAYFMGLINARQRRELAAMQSAAAALARAERWSEASAARARVLAWLQDATGLATLLDAAKRRPYATEPLGRFLNRADVRAALGARAGGEWVECSGAVGAAMREDVMKSVKAEVEALLRATRVLLYQGVRDLQDGVASTEAWLRELHWDGLRGFQDADRAVWRAAGPEAEAELAGYVQRYGALTHAAVYGAGHLVPADNRRAAQDLIEGWVMQTGLFGGCDDGLRQAA